MGAGLVSSFPFLRLEEHSAPVGTLQVSAKGLCARPPLPGAQGGGACAPGRLVLALTDGGDQNGRGMPEGVQSTRAGGRLVRSKPRRTGCQKWGVLLGDRALGTGHWTE